MIVLSKEQIEEMVDPDQMMDQIEEAYRIYGSGEFYMPPRPTVEHENKQLMYMPCYTKDIIGTKILSIFPENSKLGLPSIDGIVLLNDYTTGAPLAVMDGQSVTAWRTGAVGGVGICQERTAIRLESSEQECRDSIRLCMHVRQEISIPYMCSTTVTVI